MSIPCPLNGYVSNFLFGVFKRGTFHCGVLTGARFNAMSLNGARVNLVSLNRAVVCDWHQTALQINQFRPNVEEWALGTRRECTNTNRRNGRRERSPFSTRRRVAKLYRYSTYAVSKVKTSSRMCISYAHHVILKFALTSHSYFVINVLCT